MVPASLVNSTLAADVADLRRRRTAASARVSASGSHSALASENAITVAARGADRGVLRADLAAARQLEHPVGAGGARRSPRCASAAPSTATMISSRSRGQSSASALRDLGLDHGLLVVGGDDERHEAVELARRRGGRRALQTAQERAARARRAPASRRSGRRRSRRARARRRDGGRPPCATLHVVATLTDGVITLRPPGRAGHRRALPRVPGPRDPALDRRPVAVSPRARDRVPRAGRARARARARSLAFLAVDDDGTLLGSFSVMELDRAPALRRDRLLGGRRRRAGAASPRGRSRCCATGARPSSGSS